MFRNSLVLETSSVQVSILSFSFASSQNFPSKTLSTLQELDLPIAKYDVDQKQWDHDMRKIVDADGHDAGWRSVSRVAPILRISP